MKVDFYFEKDYLDGLFLLFKVKSKKNYFVGKERERTFCDLYLQSLGDKMN